MSFSSNFGEVRGECVGFTFPPCFLFFDDFWPARIMFRHILRDEWQYPLLIESLLSFGQCPPICLGVLCHDCVSTKKLIARLECIGELWISQIARKMLFWLPTSPARQSISWEKGTPATMEAGTLFFVTTFSSVVLAPSSSSAFHRVAGAAHPAFEHDEWLESSVRTLLRYQGCARPCT